jgi:tetratricopeptide (TPR) repeat protein
MQSGSKNQSVANDSPDLQEKIKEAELYLEQGLFDIARQIYQDLLDGMGSEPDQIGDPDAIRSHQMRGEFLQEQIASIDRQEAEFHGHAPEPEPEKPTEEPDEGTALFNRGLALMDIGMFSEAIQEFQRAAKLGHETTESLLLLGKAHIQTDQQQEGIRILQEAYKRSDLSESEKNQFLEQMALGYEAANDKTKALELYQKIFASDPKNPTAVSKLKSLSRESQRYHLNLAKLHMKNKQFLKAIEELRTLQRKYNVAVGEIIPIYEYITQKDPENIDALRNLAEISVSQQDLPKAAEYLERIQEIRPRESRSEEQLTSIYGQMLDSGQYGEDVRLKLARHLVRSGQFDLAMSEYLEVMLEDSPHKMTALSQLGEVLLERQAYDRILELLGDALPWVESLEPGPETVNYYYLLGTACEKKYLYDQAQEHFKRAVAIDPSNEAIRAKVETQEQEPLISQGNALLRLRMAEKLEYHIQENIGQDEIHKFSKVTEGPGDTVRIAKTLLPPFSGASKVKEFVVRWSHEQVTMENRNIARVLDVAECQGSYYIIMEDFQSNLEQLLKEKNNLSLPEAVRLARALLNALAYAHSHRSTDDTLRKIFHLALNPRRVIVGGNLANAKIVDFGLIPLLNSMLDYTPDYKKLSASELAFMAPEQFTRSPSRMTDKMKQATDLYSFGLLFYLILTGKLPFEGPSPEDFKKQHTENYPVPPRVFISTIPAKLDDAILRCLHKDPKKRWRTPTELDLALEKIDLRS